jgi:hypothetical protein
MLMSAEKPFDPLLFCGPFDEFERRHDLIAQAAYFRAKRRHFAPGREREDWFAAEAEVDRLLAGGIGSPCDRT